MIGEIAFGRTRWRMIRRVGVPIEYEASTKTSFRTTSVWLRMRRTKAGTYKMVRANATLVMPGPRTPAIASASTKPGMLIRASVARMMSRSTLPPM